MGRFGRWSRGCARKLDPPEGRGTATPTNFWHRDDLAAAILDALTEAGLRRDTLSVDDLAPLDHFHSGGKSATVRLARRAGLAAGMRVLDVGGGVGGPARTLAVEFGCRVTVVDRTSSLLAAAAALTDWLGLRDRVTHVLGDAEALPFAPGVFDVVWTQNSGMEIADKERLYASFHRTLRDGGVLALQEPVAGPVQPPHFPLMWARDASESHLWPPARLRAAIEAAGFALRVWDDVTEEIAATRTGTVANRTIQDLVMGDTLPAIAAASRRNRAERRTAMVQAVLVRTPESATEGVERHRGRYNWGNSSPGGPT